jgi:hypothetical protein
VATGKAGKGVIPGVKWRLFGARFRIVIPKKFPEMTVEGLGGTSVLTSGLPPYANDPETVPVVLLVRMAVPVRLTTVAPAVEELLESVI